jgi:hypothetical protein
MRRNEKFMKKKIIIASVICLIAIVVMSKISVTETIKEVKLPEVELTGKELPNNFYYNDLTEKEKKAYDTIAERIENFEGGSILLGDEYSVNELNRISNCLIMDGKNYFYAVISNYMTERHELPTDTYLKDSHLDDERYTDVILWIFCVKDITTIEDIDEKTGKLNNYEEIVNSTNINDTEKKAEIIAQLKETDEVIDSIIEGIPDGADQKETIDYFVNWMVKNVVYDYDEYNAIIKEEESVDSENAAEISEENEDKNELIATYYKETNLVCVTTGKAMCGGFASTLTALCRRVGIDAITVIGTCNSIGHAVTQVNIDGTIAYIDVSGLWDYTVGRGKMISEKEIKKRMHFYDYPYEQ